MQRSFTRPNGACHRGDNEKSGKILVLALGAEIGFEVDAQDCSPTGRSDGIRASSFASGILRSHPRGLEGNPQYLD